MPAEPLLLVELLSLILGARLASKRLLRVLRLPFPKGTVLVCRSKIPQTGELNQHIYFYLFIYRFYLFIHERHTQRERQRHRQREKQAPHREPDAGLDPRTSGSHPGLKADAQSLSPPRHPKCHRFLY